MKNSTLLVTLLTIFISMIPLATTAEIYTWIDKDGKVHYSDKPVENATVSIIVPKVNNNISVPTTMNSQWQKDYNAAKAQKAKQLNQQEKQKAKNKNMCEQAKSQLAIYNQGGRLYLMSASGEREYQSDEQLSAQKKKFSKLIKTHCS